MRDGISCSVRARTGEAHSTPTGLDTDRLLRCYAYLCLCGHVSAMLLD